MQVFRNYCDAQLRLRHAQNNVDTKWRMIERALIEYFRELHIPLADGGGTQFVEVVLFNGPDDLETSWISLEDLARRLADEVVAMTGGRGARQKGNRLERALVRALQDHGFAAERVPLSGSAGGSYTSDLTVPLLATCASRRRRAAMASTNSIHGSTAPIC
jgi:hypothetical protein